MALQEAPDDGQLRRDFPHHNPPEPIVEEVQQNSDITLEGSNMCFFGGDY